MLVDMKGVALAWGALLAILLVTTFVLMNFIAKATIRQTVIVKSGAMISFVNNAEMIMREFNASIVPISQRAAYDLGKTGGSPDMQFWGETPTLGELETNLENQISSNLPSESFTDSRQFTWLGSYVKVIPCEPLDSSNCFSVEGWKIFNYFDPTYNSILLVNNSFDQTVESSYFKLLYIARNIVDNTEYTRTSQQLSHEYDLTISNTKEGNIYTISITDDRCLPGAFYCLAPLNSTEEKQDINGNLVPFNYLNLTFSVNTAPS